MKRREVYNVQALRLVAALGVTISHSADLLIPHNEQNAWFWSVPWTGGVDLFFVISGFIMLMLGNNRFGTPGAASNFLKRRLIRIVPPYWLVTTLTIMAVELAGGRLKGTSVDWLQAITSYGFIPWQRADGAIVPIVGQGWTLNYEMLFYLAFTCALLIRSGAMLLGLFFVGLVILNPFVPEFLVPLKFWSRPIILEFLGGMLIARVYLTGYRLSAAGTVGGACAAIAIYVLASNFRSLSSVRAISFGIPALLLAASVILASEPSRLNPVQRFILLGGDASYALYLLHYMIINAVALIWLRAHLSVPWVGVGTGVLCSLAAAIIFYTLVERPSTAWLRRRFLPFADGARSTT